MPVSSGSGAAVATTPEGGSPTAPSSSEDVNPSPQTHVVNRHPILRWRTE